MLVEVTIITKERDGTGRSINATKSGSIDPSKIESVLDVSFDYQDVGPHACSVTMQSGQTHIIKASVREIIAMRQQAGEEQSGTVQL